MLESTFRLKELVINMCDINKEGLEAFIMDHVGTIESLKTWRLGWDISTILNRCKCLKSLELGRVTINDLKTLSTVEELRLTSRNYHSTWLKQFPNVQSLTVCGASPEALQIISRSMTKLEGITIRSGMLKGLVAPTLKKVTLKYINGFIPENFFSLHNQIEELELFHLDTLDDDLLEVITSNLLLLKILKIAECRHLTLQAFMIIRNNCKCLQIFTMSTSDEHFHVDVLKCLFNKIGLQIYVQSKYIYDGNSSRII